MFTKWCDWFPYYDRCLEHFENAKGRDMIQRKGTTWIPFNVVSLDVIALSVIGSSCSHESPNGSHLDQMIPVQIFTICFSKSNSISLSNVFIEIQVVSSLEICRPNFVIWVQSISSSLIYSHYKMNITDNYGSWQWFQSRCFQFIKILTTFSFTYLHTKAVAWETRVISLKFKQELWKVLTNLARCFLR